MSRKRRHHTPEFKARAGLEALRGVEPVHAIAARHKVHPVQVSQRRNPTVAVRGRASLGQLPSDNQLPAVLASFSEGLICHRAHRGPNRGHGGRQILC
ncbi:MAG: transposase, partial [Opitutaceae bacterium]